jgi:hypothetical protein
VKELRGYDYKRIKKKLTTRFSHVDAPSSARRKLLYARQKEDESMVDFADRIETLVKTGHPKANRQTTNEIETETFLKSCKNKEAARIVMDKEPKNIEKAVKEMKKAIDNHRALFGTRSPHMSRQVTFSGMKNVDTDDYQVRSMTVNGRQGGGSRNGTPERSVSPAATQADIAKLTSSMNLMFTKLSDVGRRRQTPSPQRLLKMQCFSCREYGHLAKDCPNRSSLAKGKEGDREKEMPSPAKQTPLNN